MADIRVFHLLVKHNESRRPSSWREDRITRSKAEAIQSITEFKKMIEDDPRGKAIALAERAEKFSDCSSARNRGDLGWAKPGSYQKPFEDAARALKEGELSDVVISDSGVHLIYKPVQER